jgi:hypothetical protein
MIGPWRDPISGRWVVEKPPLRVVEDRPLENPEQDLIDRIKIDTVWRALQASAEASRISNQITERE